MTNFQEKLREILAKGCIDDMDVTMHSTCCQCDESAKEITELVKEIVPEALVFTSDAQYYTRKDYNRGSNDCRQEILRALEGGDNEVS